jgi:hypothetical protein
MSGGLAPAALAMIICDAIHVDPGTGKRTLLGLFSAVMSTEFPALVPAIAVHVALTECRGKFSVLLQVVDANEEREPVGKLEGDVEFDDPLGILELDFRLGNLEFPEPGEYRFQLYVSDEPIIERWLLLL